MSFSGTTVGATIECVGTVSASAKGVAPTGAVCSLTGAVTASVEAVSASARAVSASAEATAVSAGAVFSVFG